MTISYRKFQGFLPGKSFLPETPEDAGAGEGIVSDKRVFPGTSVGDPVCAGTGSLQQKISGEKEYYLFLNWNSGAFRYCSK